jgi:hypothetical protein
VTFRVTSRSDLDSAQLVWTLRLLVLLAFSPSLALAERRMRTMSSQPTSRWNPIRKEEGGGAPFDPIAQVANAEQTRVMRSVEQFQAHL